MIIAHDLFYQNKKKEREALRCAQFLDYPKSRVIVLK